MAASADSNSTATSLEDRTEDLDTDTGHNPTRDTLAEGLLCLVRPTIDTLETQVSATLSAQVSSLFVALHPEAIIVSRLSLSAFTSTLSERIQLRDIYHFHLYSRDSRYVQSVHEIMLQSELKDQIVRLQTNLKTLQQQQSCPVDLDSYVVKLGNTKKRVTVVANILAAAQDRLNKVHQNCLKETARRRALLEPSPSTTPGPEEPARLPK